MLFTEDSGEINQPALFRDYTTPSSSNDDANTILEAICLPALITEITQLGVIPCQSGEYPVRYTVAKVARRYLGYSVNPSSYRLL